MTDLPTKLLNIDDRVTVSSDAADTLLRRMLGRLGCDAATATAVSRHLVEASCAGVESHGVWRIITYAEQYRSGYLDPTAQPQRSTTARGGMVVDGCGGIGIPAMHLAVDWLAETVRAQGMATVAIRNVGHTGRLGSYAEALARQQCLCIIIGGGGRKNWRLVAPYGGRRPLLSTNPYCIGVPGGEDGPVVADFATSALAAGWVYSARKAGAALPPGMLVDRDGRPSTDPEDYFAGGAILPAGGAKGYALAVAAEMIAEGMLGPATTECNWLLLGLDTTRYRDPGPFGHAAEEILAELRACPPSDGFARVEVPGERERRQARSSRGEIHIPGKLWAEIQALDRDLEAGAPAVV